MNRSIRTTALVAVAASAVLTGCAGTVDRNKDVEAAAPTLVEPPEIIEPETTFPTPTRVGPPTNERGNIEAALGDEGTLSDLESGTPVVTYAIDAIGPVQCRPDHYEYGSSPENGNLIAVDMRASTAPELAQSDFGSYFTISGYDFSFVGPDGVTVTELSTMATYSCLDSGEQFTSDQLRPGSNYTGKIVLDVPATTGAVIYRPSGVDSGWEITF